MVFSILGVGVLFLMANFTDVEEVPISGLSDHEGEMISTRGMVVGHHLRSSGSSRLLLVDNGTTVEVYIERSDLKMDPGQTVKVKGDVFETGGSYSITLQSDNGLEKLEGSEPVPFEKDLKPWTPVDFEGIIASTSGSGWSEVKMTIVVELETGPFFLSMETMYGYSDIRSGDTIHVGGLTWDDGTVHCYGEFSLELLFRPESATSSLLSVLDRLSNSPADIPTGKMDLRGYLKYEPTYTSLYISDEPQGSSVSIKVTIPEKDPLIHMGDLISLVNTTFFWDPNGLRYVLMSEHVEVIASHGPWYLKMDNLDHGLSSYENAEAVIEGDVISGSDRRYLVDGDSRVELRWDLEIPMGGERTFLGIVRMDHLNNTYYLDITEEIG